MDDNDVMNVALNMGGDFNEASLTMLQEFVLAFENLSKATSATFKPAGGGGLSEFQTSLQNVNTQLQALNANLEKVKTGTAGVGTATKSTAGSVKVLTDEQMALKVQNEEMNKKNKEFHQNNNQMFNDRQTQATKERETKKQTSALLTKEQADQKVANKLHNDQMIKSAQLDNEIFQKKLAQTEKEKEAAKEKTRLQREGDQQKKSELKTIQDSSNALLVLKRNANEAATAYANAVKSSGSKDSPEAVAALDKFNRANKDLNEMNVSLGRASSNVQLFGGGLNTAFNYMRQMAYILPGLGIAGIFNLAFEAIGKIISALGLFNDKQTEIYEASQKIAESYKEQLAIMEELRDTTQELWNTYSQSPEGLNRMNEELKARGHALDEIFPKEIDYLKKATEESKKAAQGVAGSYEGNVDEMVVTLEHELFAIDEMQKKIQELTRNRDLLLGKKAGTVSQDDFNNQFDYPKYGEFDILAFNQAIKSAQDSRDIQKTIYDQAFSTVKTYADNKKALLEKMAEYERFLDDEERRRKLEFAKSEISVEQDKQGKILAAEISSHEQKKKALLEEKRLQEELTEAQNQNVQTNINATAVDKKIATQNRNDQMKIISAQYSTDRAKLDEEYRQRLLSAQEKIDKDRVDSVAIANEKVFRNEQQSLEKRLEAYDVYIDKKQELQDIEYARAIEHAYLKAEGPVPTAELEAIESNKVKQKASIQADVENQVYTIVKQSYERQMHALELKINQEDQLQLNAYTKELKDLTDSFLKKEISYRKYRENITKISKQYGTNVLVERYADEGKDLGELTGFRDQQITSLAKARTSLAAAQSRYDLAVKGGNKESIQEAKQFLDSAQGKVTGFEDTVAASQSKIETLQKTHNKTANEIQQSRILTEEEKEKEADRKRKERLQAIKQMEQAIYQATKEIVDRRYEEKARRLQEENDLIQKNLELQLAAVQKSSLSEKEKNALDAQLSAEKNERDRQAAAEQKKIKHDQAVFDKKLALMHITFSTAIAVAELIGTPWLAVAAGVVGAAQFATVASQEIPSYAEGTKGHKGGWARFGEAGAEVVKEPYRSPYLVYQDTIGYLPKGTEVIPIGDSPNFDGRDNTSWEQTKWLAKQLKPQKEKSKNVNIINIDLGFESHKRKILGY